jgi:hypothetical protein
MTAPTALHVRRDDLRSATPVPLTLGALANGQARFRIDRFALTSNNVTYAAHGEDLGYWRFYPAPAGLGIVPVWGFATVEESRVDGIAAGERFYGYWPMATHAVLTPVKVTARGFTDGAAHRADLPAVYNNYQRWTGAAADEAPQALFRPLYTTAFLIAEHIAGAGQVPAAVIMSSASSKTALGLAFALRDREIERIGLTSPRNRAFVERTDAYDRVLGYHGISHAKASSAAYVDFAGDGAVRRDVHERFAESLTASIVVGDTHWEVPAGGEALPGPRPEFFFAPTHLAARLAEWGPGEFERRLGESWNGFVGFARDRLTFVEGKGADEVARQWRRMAEGDVDPAEGLMLSMHD